MDIAKGFKEFSENYSRFILDYGSFQAETYLQSHFAVSSEGEDSVDQIKAEAYIQGLIASLNIQKQIDADRIVQAFNQLSRLGLNVPVQTLRHAGMPLSEIVVSYSPSLGRLGDFLSQMRTLASTRFTRNLVLTFPLHDELSSRCAFVLGGDGFLSTRKPYIYELSHVNLAEFIRLDDASQALIDACPWLLRCMPPDLFSEWSSAEAAFSEDHSALHLRGGDALHEDIVYYQPPLSYYLEAIERLACKHLALVSEPDRPEIGRVNPLRGEILSFCEKKGVEVKTFSSSRLSEDAAVLYKANSIISGTSLLGREIGLCSVNCKNLVTPLKELDVPKDSELTSQYGLSNLAPDISVVDIPSYPASDEWKNLEIRYSWLLNN